ncbi:uncharacterized protein LOC133290891 [Gastrolobium bilobum]|uniref:uncharacterized protein LOC133290891 n=1 Tax=Gastrolobium bilobum TaxID=150636 RepID=UPI002AB2E6D3|nr:uncharacterized protein LOC133290891 [Gastrolobium bilobum]XP_061345023.1 uncharacterized protein LOC133290891 [Gastrolobium bilobum]XP_061345024.1 uncharacterized protein LOC133290891 [Gastrolobium bilobum]
MASIAVSAEADRNVMSMSVVTESEHVLVSKKEGEGDNYEILLNHGDGPSARNNYLKKRKRGKKREKRQVIDEKLQHSLDRILEYIDQLSHGLESINSFSMTRCLTLLKDVPGLEEGSSAYKLAPRIFIPKQNREAFIYYMENEPHKANKFLSMFTFEHVKNYR